MKKILLACLLIISLVLSVACSSAETGVPAAGNTRENSTSLPVTTGAPVAAAPAVSLPVAASPAATQAVEAGTAAVSESGRPSARPAETTAVPAPAARKKVVVVDQKERTVEITAPVERIVSLNNGASTFICAMGAGNRIVGRDSNSIFPSLLLKKPAVAGTSYDPNMEKVLELNPDVVIGDTMMKEANISQLEAHGIPVIIDSPSELSRLPVFIENMGLILDNAAGAREIAGEINRYRNLVQERLSGLSDSQKPRVFYEWNRPYYSASSTSVYHGALLEAGGINIAAAETAKYPQLSAEWVMQQNPDIIVRTASGQNDAEALLQLRNSVLSRPELQNVQAVKNDRVFILGYGITNGLRYHIGLLYLSQYFHPDLFGDIDPYSIHRDLVVKYFGETEWDNNTLSYACPEP